MNYVCLVRLAFAWLPSCLWLACSAKVLCLVTFAQHLAQLCSTRWQLYACFSWPFSLVTCSSAHLKPLPSRCRLPETCARLHLHLELFVFLMTPLMLFCVRAPSHVEFWCCRACASDEIFSIVFCSLASWHFLFACVVQTGILTSLPRSLVFIARHSMTVICHVHSSLRIGLWCHGSRGG